MTFDLLVKLIFSLAGAREMCIWLKVTLQKAYTYELTIYIKWFSDLLYGFAYDYIRLPLKVNPNLNINHNVYKFRAINYTLARPQARIIYYIQKHLYIYTRT